MRIKAGWTSAFAVPPALLLLAVAAIALLPRIAAAQGLTGAFSARSGTN